MTKQPDNKAQRGQLRGNPEKDRARGEIIDEFTAYLQALRRDESTIRKYVFGLGEFFDYLDRHGITDLRSVRRQDLQDYQEALMKADITTHTVHVRMRAVRRFYEYLEANNRILINPALGLRMPKLEDRLPRNILTRAEARRILDAPDTSHHEGIRDKAMLEVFYSTGLRVGELCALTIYDVDVLSGYVRVNSGKGCKDRVVPLGHKARKYVKEYMQKVRGVFTRNNRDERALFVGARCGRPIHPRYLGNVIHQYADQARIRKNVTAHVFRHTCATHMIASGADVVHVQRILGHAFLSTTQVYTRVTRTDIKKTHRKTHPREQGQE